MSRIIFRSAPKIRCRPLLVCLIFTSLLFANSSFADETIDRAKAMLDAGKAADAYALLKPLEEDRAGDPNFDYVYGLSALDSGKPLEAVFALERAVDAAPENGPARAELARAYLVLGDTDDARSEFDKVQEMDLPSDVQKTIDQYISTIDQYHDASRIRYRPYVSVGLGYDGNVNSATTESQIAVPALGGLIFNLSGQSLETHSAIWDLAAGVRVTAPINLEKGISLFTNIGINHRLALEESNFSTTIGNGQAGVNWRIDGKNQFRLSADGNVVKVDGSSAFRSDREAIGSTAQWQYTPDEANQFTAFGQFSLVRYPEQRVRDVNRYTAGVGWGHAFLDAAYRPVVFLSLFGGVEDEKSESAGSHFSRDFIGVRGGGQITVHEGGSLFGSITYQYSDYKEPDPTFLEERQDDFIDLNFGYRYQFDENWSVSPTIQFNNNDSNIITSDYDRFSFMVTVRNDF
ncbi:MAG: porin family protein [Pseudomonadota bacterium]